MTMTTTLKTRIDPRAKARFNEACVTRGTLPSDAIRRFINEFVSDKNAAGLNEGRVPYQEERRWKVVNTRLSQSEWSVLSDTLAAEQINVSRWLLRLIRSALTQGPQLRDKELEALEQATFQLRGIGRNLNQMVRAIHEGRADPGRFSERYAHELNERIDGITNSIDTLVSSASARDID